MNMILIRMLSKMKNGKAMVKSANNKIVIFCFNVILLSRTKLSKCFLYIEVPLNQTSNFFEPLTKKKEANNKSGVVGTTGRMIPMIPIPMHIKPAIIYKLLIILLIRTIPFFGDRSVVPPLIDVHIQPSFLLYFPLPFIHFF